MTDVEEIVTKFTQASVRLDLLRDQLVKKNEKLKNLHVKHDNLIKLQTLIQQTAKSTQETLKLHIENLAQSAIDTVWPSKYVFRANFDISRNQTECDIFLEDINGQRLDPTENNGGGVVDVLSIALRIACWSISGRDNVLLLDEPLKWVSATYKAFIAEIVKSISRKLNLQLIIVTHENELISIADKVFVVDQKGRLKNSYLKEVRETVK